MTTRISIIRKAALVQQKELCFQVIDGEHIQFDGETVESVTPMEMFALLQAQAKANPLEEN